MAYTLKGPVHINSKNAGEIIQRIVSECGKGAMKLPFEATGWKSTNGMEVIPDSFTMTPEEIKAQECKDRGKYHAPKTEIKPIIANEPAEKSNVQQFVDKLDEIVKRSKKDIKPSKGEKQKKGGKKKK